MNKAQPIDYKKVNSELNKQMEASKSFLTTNLIAKDEEDYRQLLRLWSLRSCLCKEEHRINARRTWILQGVPQ